MTFAGLALACVLGTASPAVAEESLSEAVQDLLDDVQAQVDQVEIWKLKFTPTARQSFVWTDNVFLNDHEEMPFRLTSYTGKGGKVVTNPKRLRQIQATVPEFQDVESRGRVDDTISRSTLGLNFDLPTNDRVTKFFNQKSVRVLGIKLTRNDYFDLNELDNNGYEVESNIFGFLNDLFRWTGAGEDFWMRAGYRYSRIEEALDLDITEIQSIDILSRNFDEFDRVEHKFDLEAGYKGPKWDVIAGGDFFTMRLNDIELRQAEYNRRNAHLEIGHQLPWFQNKRAFLRADYDVFRPRDRAFFTGPGASAPSKGQALNDGDRMRGVLGVNGNLFSKKVAGRIEGGYMSWDSDDNGASGDDSNFHGWTAGVSAAWRPWTERKTQFQVSYQRTVEQSALSNFNAVHRGTITVLHELIPRKLDADISFGVTRTDRSGIARTDAVGTAPNGTTLTKTVRGPNSILYDAGFGLTYKLADQASLSLRYLYRRSDSFDELLINTAFNKRGQKFVFTSQSDGDFFQNVIEIGLSLNF